MNRFTPLESFTAGAPTAVDVTQINRQLQQLWQLAAESGPPTAQHAVTRAVLLNFVVICDSADAQDRVTAVLGKLTAAYPSRAIVVVAQPEAPQPELSAAISAHCHPAGGGRKQVCCEQITIHATGPRVASVASAVLSLLEADLPTILWWPGNFLEQPVLFAQLSTVADRLLFDTSQWSNPWQHLPALRHSRICHPHCGWADLSWTRLSAWRELVAEVFDEPLAQPELARLSSVEIVHGGGAGAAWRAELLSAWLAAQLGWSPAQWAARVQQREERASDPGTAQGLRRVILRSAAAEIAIVKNRNEQAVTTTVTTPTACGLPRRRALWPTDEPALLSEELDRPQRQDLYQRALAMLASRYDAVR